MNQLKLQSVANLAYQIINELSNDPVEKYFNQQDSDRVHFVIFLPSKNYKYCIYWFFFTADIAVPSAKSAKFFKNNHKCIFEWVLLSESSHI